MNWIRTKVKKEFVNKITLVISRIVIITTNMDSWEEICKEFPRNCRLHEKGYNRKSVENVSSVCVVIISCKVWRSSDMWTQNFIIHAIDHWRPALISVVICGTAIAMNILSTVSADLTNLFTAAKILFVNTEISIVFFDQLNSYVVTSYYWKMEQLIIALNVSFCAVDFV